MAFREELSIEEKGEKKKIKLRGCKLPLWVLVSIFAATPIVIVAISVTSIIYTQGQAQVDDMYQNLKTTIQNGIQDNFDEYLNDMKLAASVVQQVDSQIFTNGIPYSNYDASVLIHLMNSFSGTQAFESLGFVKRKANATGTEKLNWELARGSSFGCSEYLFAYCDESIYPNFYGVCAYTNLTVDYSNRAYTGTDWGFSSLQFKLVNGDVDETFLPIFPLINYFTLSYGVNIRSRSNPSVIYGYSFAQRSLRLIDDFLKTIVIGNGGIIYVLESNTGLLVSASVDNQTTLLNNSQVQRVKASDAQNKRIKASAAFLESEIGFSDNAGISEPVGYEKNLDGESLLIDAVRYKNAGVDWTVVIVVPSSDFFGRITKSSGISLGVSAAIVVVALIGTIIWSRIVVKPLSSVKRNMEKLALLQFKDLEPTEESNVSEFREIQESYANLEKELAKKMLLFLEFSQSVLDFRMTLAILFVSIFIGANSFRIGNETLDSARYSCYGNPPSSSLISTAVLGEPFDSCDALHANMEDSNYTGKMIVFSFTREDKPRQLCSRNRLMRKLEQLGASGAIFLYKIKSEELGDIYSLTEEKSDFVYLTPFVYDSEVHIPSITLSRYDSILFLRVLANTSLVTFEPPDSDNIRGIQIRRGFYITMRVFACVAFFSLFVAALVLVIRMTTRRLRKKRAVGIAPFVLLSEVLVVCIFRFIHNAIDPFGYLGIVNYFADHAIYDFMTLLMISAYILLVLFWVTAILGVVKTSKHILLPRVLFYVFIGINLGLVVGEIVILYNYTLIVWNSLIGALVLTVDVSFLIVYIKLMRALKKARDMKSTVLKKISKFVLAITVVSFITIVSVAIQALYREYTIGFQVLYRILESILLSLIIILFWDKRVNKEIGASSGTTISRVSLTEINVS